MTDHNLQAAVTDAVMDAYLDWREHAVAVTDAYWRWTRTATSHRQAAHAAYGAALDCEAAAAARLRSLVGAAVDEPAHTQAQ